MTDESGLPPAPCPLPHQGTGRCLPRHRRHAPPPARAAAHQVRPALGVGRGWLGPMAWGLRNERKSVLRKCRPIPIPTFPLKGESREAREGALPFATMGLVGLEGLEPSTKGLW